jgi:hypothetical protein
MFVFGEGSEVKCKIPAIAVQIDAATAIMKIEFINFTYLKTYNNMLILGTKFALNEFYSCAGLNTKN